MAILKVKDDEGNVFDIPAIRGKDGDDGRTPVYGVDYPKIEIINSQDPNSGCDYVTIRTVIETEEDIIEENVGSIRQPKDGRTPVKGIDYFTEDDKAEMVQNVLGGLPVFNMTVTFANGAIATYDLYGRSVDE